MQPPVQLNISQQEIDQEVIIAKKVVSRSIATFLKSVDLISEGYLAQTLIALWDSGLYDYVRRRDRLEIEAAANELRLDAGILRWLVEYLVGRGIMTADGTAFVLTDIGRAYWNYVTRGALTSHLGGYNALLTNLGPLLRKEIDLENPLLDRSERLVAIGAGCTLLGSDTVPWVLSAIRKLNGTCALDLGCGSGVFLTRLAATWPDGRGVGIDKNVTAIERARTQAQAHGVADRLQFCEATLSAEPMRLDASIFDPVDVVTAIFILHEFTGRGGDQAVASVLTALRNQLPGRKLLLVEGSRADPYERKTGPVRSHAQLDYSLIHLLSRQGRLRTPDEWKLLIESTGARLLDVIAGFQLIPSWINLYVIEL